MMPNAASPRFSIVLDGVVRQNVVTVRLLALCPMLAVSVSLRAAALLGVLTLCVMALSGFLVAVLRPLTPASIRLPVFMVIVATGVALADSLLAAFWLEGHRQLGIFLPLIITNCAVLARLEVFASRQPPAAAFIDGVSCGLGMALALMLLATGRELLGTGKIAGLLNIPGFDGVPSAILPVGGFILFALMLAAFRALRLTPSA